jgi:pimeloyl-ACP methyl ester carboxylesterase
MHGHEPADLSAYDRSLHTNEQIEQWLVQGLHSRELIAYLGEAEFELLAPLARAAARTTVDRRMRVFIVPGIMGTQLGRARDAPWPTNLLWIDPVDIMSGRLTELKLSTASTLKPLGAITYTYLALKLRLNLAGCAVTLYEYDWRRDIGELGRELALAIEACDAQHVALVTHSMGGLLARAALRSTSARVQRVITLGTPHFGTLAPVQALRGTYPTVRRLAALDRLHSAEALTESIFRDYPSLYGMLPGPAHAGGLDLFDAGSWPASGPCPNVALLREALAMQRTLAGGDERYHCIAGIGQRTATALRLVADDFEYEVSSDGDGTVPAPCAVLDGTCGYYIDCEHSDLPRNATVAAAVGELLRDGRTSVLAREHHASADAHVLVTDAALRLTYVDKIDWKLLSADERRRYLNQLNLAPPHYAAAAAVA